MNRFNTYFRGFYRRYIIFLSGNSPKRSFLMPAIISLLALIIRWLLLPAVGTRYPYILSNTVVIMSSILCGIPGGVIATIISTFLFDIFLVFHRVPTSSEFFSHIPTITIVIQGFVTTLSIGLLERALRFSRTETQTARLGEQRFRILADSAPVLIWLAGKDKKRTFFNKGWLDFSGKSSQQMIGSGWKRIIHPEDKEEYFRLYKNSFDAQKPFRKEYRVRRHDGVYRWILASAVPVFTEDNEFNGFIGSAIDITKRKENEKSLAEYAAMVKSSDDAIFSKSLEGVITSWNRGAENIYGYTAKEMVGQSVSILFPKNKKKSVKEILDTIKQGKSIDHFETQRVRKDKRIIDVSVSISCTYDEEGKLIGASVIARDITEKKFLERKKDEFISTASHEFKTPLTSMKAFTELLYKYIKSNNTEKMTHAVDRIHSQIIRLTELTEELLDVSRVSLGKLLLRLEPINIHELVSSVIQDIQPTTDHKIIFNSKNTELTVNGDKFRLSQVLVNLLTNAIKYSPGATKVIVSIQENKKTVTVQVQDFGIGIPQKDQAMIFDRFYQVRHSQEGITSGLGLGLYVSAEIVKRHKGTIHIHSEEGEGTTFSFTLPCGG